MPRYYLNLRRGHEVARDHVGTEFHDQVTAELEALRAADGAWRQMKIAADPSRYFLEIMDAAGQSVLTIPVSDILMAD